MALIKLTTTLCLLLLIIFIISNTSPALAVVVPKDAAASTRNRLKLSAAQKKSNRVDPKLDCSEYGSRSECAQISNCRWCKSEALDDMCFSKSEAWRLPSQVFTCHF